MTIIKNPLMIVLCYLFNMAVRMFTSINLHRAFKLRTYAMIYTV